MTMMGVRDPVTRRELHTFRSCWQRNVPWTDSVVLLTGVDEILTFSVGSTTSCHLMSYAPTSPSNLFHPDGAMILTPRPPSWNASSSPPIRVVTRGVSSSGSAMAGIAIPVDKREGTITAADALNAWPHACLLETSTDDEGVVVVVVVTAALVVEDEVTDHASAPPPGNAAAMQSKRVVASILIAKFLWFQ
jgi:hypothetical protein